MKVLRYLLIMLTTSLCLFAIWNCAGRGKKAETYGIYEKLEDTLFYIWAIPDESGILPLEMFPKDGEMYVRYKKNGKPLGDILIVYNRCDENEYGKLVNVFDEIIDGEKKGEYHIQTGENASVNYKDEKGDEYEYGIIKDIYGEENFLQYIDLNTAETELVQLSDEDEEEDDDGYYEVDYLYYNGYYSCYLTYLINTFPETLDYPFTQLSDRYGLDITSSDDGNLRIYTQSLRIERNYYVQDVIMQYRDKGTVYALNDFCCGDFQYAEYGYDDDCYMGGIKIYTCPIKGKNYYLVDGLLIYYHMLHHDEEAITHANVLRLYAIEDGELVAKPLFNTGKEVVDQIMIKYNGRAFYQNEELQDKSLNLFRYDAATQSIYVPLVKDISLTDKYLVYKWDGTSFTYKGVR